MRGSQDSRVELIGLLVPATIRRLAHDVQAVYICGKTELSETIVTKRFGWRESYMLVSALLALTGVAYVLTRPWTIYSDMWEQVAAIRELARDFLHPGNPMLLLSGETSVRFTPYTQIWGVVMKVMSLSTFQLLPLVAAANLILLVIGIWRFCKAVYGDARVAVLFLAAMLFVWGKGFGQSNAYQLEMFLYTAPYVSAFAYGLSFHALACLSGYLRGGGNGKLVVYFALCLTVFLSHPITGAFLIVAAFSLSLSERDWRRFAWVQAGPLLCLAAVLQWPYFDYWAVLTKGSTEAWFTSPHFTGQLTALGPALMGVPILLYFAIRKEHQFVTIGAAACLAIYFVSMSRGILIGGRFLLFAAIFFHLGIALFVAEKYSVFRRLWRERRLSAYGAALLALALLLWAARYRQREVREVAGALVQWSRDNGAPYGEDVQEYIFLEATLGPKDVLLAPSTLGLILPALSGGKVVGHIHGNPLINDELTRRCARADDFFGEMSVEDRTRVILDYGVTHVLLDGSDSARAVRGQIERLGSIIARFEDQVLLRLD